MLRLETFSLDGNFLPSFFKISRAPVAWLNVRKPTYEMK